MKVTGNGPSSADKAREGSRTGGASGITGKERRGAGHGGEVGSDLSEKVAISNRAKEVAKAMEAARSAPDIDEAKVARFKSAIQNGSYKPDADKIADRLVDEHLASAF